MSSASPSRRSPRHGPAADPAFQWSEQLGTYVPRQAAGPPSLGDTYVELLEALGEVLPGASPRALGQLAGSILNLAQAVHRQRART